MPNSPADYNLLLGILAYQNAFVSRSQLIAGMQAWLFDKSKSLAEVLAAQGVLDEERRTLLEALVKQHLKQHGDDPQRSLAAVDSICSARADLEQLADSEVQASLAAVSVARPDEDPSATRSFAVGESSSLGLRFRILRPHAEGGLGKVSVALDEELHREVALKEINDQHANDAGSRRRFLREAEITGGLEHPGIVPVYGLGTYANGRPFYAMRFIRGDSLKDAIARFHRKSSTDYTDSTDKRGTHSSQSVKSVDQFSGLEFRQLLGRFVDVCNAIAYAHSRGVLHRDLKPGNIMLGKYGETLVVDWGLAKAGVRKQESGVRGQPDTQEPGEPGASATGDETLLRPASGSGGSETQAGSALGTPAYMSPEQAAGRIDKLGPASDVYSLGATLYQVLTGKVPIHDKDTAAILQRVQRGDYPAPRQVNPHVPAGLEAVCQKAMALKPEGRYARAKDLADDIEHWLADEPVGAWAEPWTVKSRRWVGRHRVLVTSAAAALLVSATLLLIGNVLLSQANVDLEKANNDTITANEKLKESNEATKLAYVKLEKEQKETELARNEAQKFAKEASDRADQIEDDLATSTMQLVRSRFEENNAGLAKELLEQVPDKFRMSPWKNLTIYLNGSIDTLRGHTDAVNSVTFSPNGQMVASGSSDRSVKLWDARTGQEIRTLRGHANEVRSVTFSPDGQVIASGSYDDTVKLWDARTGLEIRTLRGHKGTVDQVTFSPDGQVVASGSADQTVKLWDARTGQEIRTLRGHTGFVSSATFSPDGQVVASASADKTVKLWDARTGQEIRTLRGHTSDVFSVTFSPDGQVVASGSGDYTVKLWDAGTGQEIRALRWHADGVTSVTFSPDGQVVASASEDQTVKLWNVRTGQEIRTLRGHTYGVRSVTFSPDGQVVASGSDDGTVKLWDAGSGPEIRTLRGHTDQVNSVTFSPDGQVVASASADQTVKLWDARTGQEIRTFRGHASPVRSVTFSPDGQVVASGSNDNTVKLWEASTGQETRALRGHMGNVSSVAFSPDGQVVASGSWDKTVKLWEARTGQEIRALPGHTNHVNSVTFSPDGRVVASGSNDDTVKLWEARTGKEILILRGHADAVRSVTFNPVSQVVASASDDMTVKLWDARTGQEIRRALRGHTYGVFSATFSPDGQIVASASDDTTVKLWDARTGQEIRALRGHTDSVFSVAFSPDGQVVASASADNTVKLWDIRTRHDPSFLLSATLPDPAEHRHHAIQADLEKQPFTAACRLGHAIAVRLRLQRVPWDPSGPVHVVANGPTPALALAGWHGLGAGRLAQSAFVDGPTFAGILLKDSGRSAKGLVVRAEWAVDQWPEGWRNHGVLGGALYRAGDYQGALRELNESQKLRGQKRSSNPRPSIWSGHFLALAHHKLGNQDEAAGWRIKAVLPKDASWEDAMIDRYLRQEVDAEFKTK